MLTLAPVPVSGVPEYTLTHSPAHSISSVFTFSGSVNWKFASFPPGLVEFMYSPPDTVPLASVVSGFAVAVLIVSSIVSVMNNSSMGLYCFLIFFFLLSFF